MHIQRTLFPLLLRELKRKEITILLGPRQVGKTYLLTWLKKQLDQKRKSSVYFNLEEPEHLRTFNQPLENIVSFLTQSGSVVFIDEFHYLKNASHIFKAIYDRQSRVKIFASGSSSLEIHKHLKESLAGRRRLVRVPPLSYSEIKPYLGRSAESYYFQFGGLPGVIKESNPKDRMALLNDLLQAYILKDIKSLIREENIRAFNTLLYLLAQNQGALISVDGLANQIGLTAPAIHKHIDILEQTYVVGTLPSYSRNLGNELRKSKKHYLYDLGIRNALLKDFRKWNQREDKGVLVESAVFLNLSMSLQPNEELRFWRTRDGQEVDFVLIRDRQPIPIEVKSSWKAPEIPSGLKSFLRRYPDTNKAYVLSMNQKERKTGRFQNATVIFDNWWGNKI